MDFSEEVMRTWDRFYAKHVLRPLADGYISDAYIGEQPQACGWGGGSMFIVRTTKDLPCDMQMPERFEGVLVLTSAKTAKEAA